MSLMPLKATWSGCQYGPHGIDKQTLRAVPGVGSAFGTTRPTLAQGPAFCRSWDPGLCPLQATSLPPWGLAGKGVATWASVLCSPPGRTLASRGHSDQGWDLQVLSLKLPLDL